MEKISHTALKNNSTFHTKRLLNEVEIVFSNIDHFTFLESGD